MNLLKVHYGFIFRVKQSSLLGCLTLKMSVLWTLEMSNYPTVETTKSHRRSESSTAVLWELQILQCFSCFSLFKHYSRIVSYVCVKCKNDLWLMKLKWYERSVNGLILSSNLAMSGRSYKNIRNLRVISILGQTESSICGKWSSSADCNIQQDGKMIIISESGFGRSWSWLVSVLIGELCLHIQ